MEVAINPLTTTGFIAVPTSYNRDLWSIVVADHTHCCVFKHCSSIKKKYRYKSLKMNVHWFCCGLLFSHTAIAELGNIGIALVR